MSRIKELRLKNGLTQNQLAELIGADSNLISRWERGKAKPISLYVQKLAQIFKTSMEYVIGDSDTNEIALASPSENANNTSEMVEIQGKIKSSPLPSKERSYTEKEHGLVYIEGNKRFEFPLTARGYEMFQKLLDKTTSVAVQ